MLNNWLCTPYCRPMCYTTDNWNTSEKVHTKFQICICFGKIMAFFSQASFSFLSPQHDYQASCWSGTYIILINSLKFKEECLGNCMGLNRNSPWTLYILLLLVFASCEQLTYMPTPFAEPALDLLLGTKLRGLCLPWLFPFMNVTEEPWA